MITKSLSNETVWIVRKAFKAGKAPIWKRLESELESPRANKSEINISKLARVTRDGETIFVPGKIMGSGRIDHKLTICAFSVSQKATKKLIDSGSKILTMTDLVESFPEGSGVRLIG
jgi:large subunit ribosomal protein L18e